jgi:hypothetical protein
MYAMWPNSIAICPVPAERSNCSWPDSNSDISNDINTDTRVDIMVDINNERCMLTPDSPAPLCFPLLLLLECTIDDARYDINGDIKNEPSLLIENKTLLFPILLPPPIPALIWSINPL